MSASQDLKTYSIGGTETFAATVTVRDEFGLHARPAANLAKAAQNFQSEISLCAGDQTADAKSILDILSLAASRDTKLRLTCKGVDAHGAGEALVKLFEERLNLSGEQ